MTATPGPRVITVTGGAGFIGANLCRELTARPEVEQVTVLDDLSSGSRKNLEGLPVELIEGSILDRPALDGALDGADAVVHLAARGSVPRSLSDPVATHEVNVTGTLEVLEAARRSEVPHVILASSSSVYGANPELPKSESLSARPVSPYAASKLAAEAYALAYAYSFGLEVLAFRFFNVFGPLQPAGHAYAAVVPVFVEAALNGSPLPVFGDGRQTRDFTYVGSVVEVLTEALLHRRSCAAPVNLAFGTRISLLELIRALEMLVGTPLKTEHLEPRAGDVRDSQADSSLLHSLFPGLRPVPLVEGLEATVEWFRGQTTSGHEGRRSAHGSRGHRPQ